MIIEKNPNQALYLTERHACRNSATYLNKRKQDPFCIATKPSLQRFIVTDKGTKTMTGPTEPVSDPRPRPFQSSGARVNMPLPTCLETRTKRKSTFQIQALNYDQSVLRFRQVRYKI